jgi:WD40 repeat protein
VVTFLFTDIEGSTRRWEADAEAMRSARAVGPPLTGHTHTEIPAGVFVVAFSPDGTRIVSGSFDNTVRVWPAPPLWPTLLCDKLTTNMSHQQWRDWVSRDIDYIKACPDLPVPPD